MGEGRSLREASGVGRGDVWGWWMGWDAGLWEQAGEGKSATEEILREMSVNGAAWGRGRGGVKVKLLWGSSCV